MNSSSSNGSSPYTGLEDINMRAPAGRKKHKGPPTCYQARQSIEAVPPSDGSMKFTVIRQLKDAFEGLAELRENEQLCDVVLVTEGQRFPCHKAILAAASRYFRGMFTLGMVECCQREVCMNLPANALGIILDFIYSAELTVYENTVCGLMSAGMMLDMPHIIEACTTFMEHHLHPSNCLTILKFSRDYQIPELQEKAERFALTRFSEMILHEEFKSLSFEELQCLIRSDDLIVNCESEVYRAVMDWISADCHSRICQLPQLLPYIRLGRVPPCFIEQQLQYCDLLRQAPSQCAEKLNSLFESLQLHTSIAEPPRQTGDTQVIYCIGGYLRQSVSNVEYWNPETNEWKRAMDIPHARSGLDAVTLNGQVYAVGGRMNLPGTQGNEDLSIVDCFDPKNNSWSPVPPMIQPRNRVSIAVLDNKLYAMGGSSGADSHDSVECYDPVGRTWTAAAPMLSPRVAAGVAVVNRFLYAVGGIRGRERMNTMEKYYPERNCWLPCSSMSTVRSGAGVCALEPHIYVAGGFNSTEQLRSMERYDTVTNTWTVMAPMINARSALSLVQLGGKLYALGGYGGSQFINAVECYDPVTNTWTEVSQMKVGRSGQGVAVGPAPPT